MATFRVLRRVDAFVDYFVEVEASDPNDAAEKAAENDTALRWRPLGVSQFDARSFVTLSDDERKLSPRAEAISE